MRITKHAKERMRERNISIQDIKTTVTYGKQLVNRTDPNKWTYVLNGKEDLYVVTDATTTVVITVWIK